jgi:hypothetical protein
MAESIHYTNCKGKTYYLHAATTKTGKTRYVMTRTAENALTRLPEGYVITESVNGQVSVGRIQPRLITELEEARVKSELEKLGLINYRIAVKRAYITIYEPLNHEDDYSSVFEQMNVFPIMMKKILAKRLAKGPFEPVMRFCIIDKEERLFDVERMTYRGYGGWRSLHASGTLPELIQRYLKHLGKDSFFDLM